MCATVNVISDNLAEGDEIFFVSLVDVLNNADLTVSPNQASITITGNGGGGPTRKN